MAKGTKELYVASELADICKVDLKTIHNWVTRGHLAAFRTPGRHLRFKVVDVLAFMTKFGYPAPASLVADAAASASAGAGEAPKTETSAAPAVVELTDEQRAAVAGWLALPAITRRSFAVELGDIAGRVGSATSRAALLALLKAFEPKDCSA